MLIDWPTVAAQVVNFLILLWLLKRFLYRPILRAMDEREAQISRRLQDAKEQRAEAREKSLSLTRQLSEIETRRTEMLAQAREESEQLRQELAVSARGVVEKTKRGWLQTLERERAAFLKELSLRAGRGTLAVARRALHDLSGVDLQERVVDVALERAKEDVATRDQIRASFSNTKVPVVVLTGDALSRASCDKVEHFLSDDVGVVAELHFDIDPNMIFGLRMKSGGWEVGLDVRSYLDELEQEFSRAIDAELEDKIESR